MPKTGVDDEVIALAAC